MRFGCRIVGMMCALLVLHGAGCPNVDVPPGGSDDGGSGDQVAAPPDGVTELTFEERAAVLEAVGQHYESLAHTSRSAENQEMLAYIQQRPEFRSARLTDAGTIAARFMDGPGFVFINNLDDSTDDDDRALKAAATSFKARVAQTVDEGLGPQLPETSKVYLLNGLSVLPGAGDTLGQFVNERRAIAHIDLLARMFEGQNYQITKGHAGVQRLREIKDADVLYFIGHGGIGIDQHDRSIFIINTSDSVLAHRMLPVLRDEALKDDIKMDRVGYEVHTGQVDEDGHRRRRAKAAYYITPEFVRHYMSFNKHSLVFINACVSAPPKAASFQDAFFYVGASMYAGWDNKVNSGEVRDSAEFLFDRLLGANLTEVIDVKSPPFRPFSQWTVEGEMMATQRAGSLFEGSPFTMAQSLDSNERLELANLVMNPRPTDPAVFGLLAPTILSIGIDSQVSTGVLRIYGDFGDAEGKVTIGGQPVPVTEWRSHQLVCDITASPDLHGDVLVTVNGHRSNPAPLTLWVGQFTLTYYGLGTLKMTATIDAHIRAGMMETRAAPGLPPGPSPNGQRGFARLTWASTANVTAEGSWQHPIYDITDSWELNGPSRLTLPADDSGERYFRGPCGEFDVGNRAASFCPSVYIKDGLRITQTQESGESSREVDFDLGVGGIPREDLTVQMDGNYNIPAGFRERVWPGEFGPTRLTIEWTAMAAQGPPTDGHAR